jgi:predicted DNA binding CopG/RHH family protein
LRLEWERQEVKTKGSKTLKKKAKKLTIRASENGITNQKLRCENKGIKLLSLGL